MTRGHADPRAQGVAELLLSQRLQLPSDSGVLAAEPGYFALEAGVDLGDVILLVGGQRSDQRLQSGDLQLDRSQQA